MKRTIVFLGLLAGLVLGASGTYGQEEVVASGELTGDFSSWGKTSLEGDWKIVSVEGKNYIELAENFRAKEAPDLKIFLSPLEASEIDGDNATDGSALVTLISEFDGASRIEIPESISLSEYNTLVFHCQDYSKLWGVSAL